MCWKSIPEIEYFCIKPDIIHMKSGISRENSSPMPLLYWEYRLYCSTVLHREEGAERLQCTWFNTCLFYLIFCRRLLISLVQNFQTWPAYSLSTTIHYRKTPSSSNSADSRPTHEPPPLDIHPFITHRTLARLDWCIISYHTENTAHHTWMYVIPRVVNVVCVALVIIRSWNQLVEIRGISNIMECELWNSWLCTVI